MKHRKHLSSRNRSPARNEGAEKPRNGVSEEPADVPKQTRVETVSKGLEEEPLPALYLVPTPIGNLEDITLRAIRVLRNVDFILAEDTRHSRTLLHHYDIEKPCESYNDFNKEKRTPGIVSQLSENRRAALICDAGTPGIADPAFFLVRAAREAGITVIPLPGPSALLPALVGSGLPTDRFSFQNFPPKKSAQRVRLLEVLKERYGGQASHPPTLVFYVSPHQVISFLGEIQQVLGPDMHLVLARELSKKFEEFLQGKPAELLEHYAQRTPRGEMVLMLHPQNKR